MSVKIPEVVLKSHQLQQLTSTHHLIIGEAAQHVGNLIKFRNLVTQLHNGERDRYRSNAEAFVSEMDSRALAKANNILSKWLWYLFLAFVSWRRLHDKKRRVQK